MIDRIGADAPMTKRLLKAVLASNTSGYRRIWARVNTRFGSFKITIHVEKLRVCWDISPIKYLVGHNLFGTNNLTLLILDILELIYKRFGLTFTERDVAFYTEQGVLLSRVDVNGCFIVGSQIKVVETMCLLREHFLDHGYNIVVHEGQDGIETLYLGKNSSCSTLKFYNKYREMLVKRNSLKLPYYDDLLNLAKKIVRFEATERTPQLQDLGRENSKVWTPGMAREILEGALHDLGLSSQLLAELPDAEVKNLKPDRRVKYHMWVDGTDLRKYYPPYTFNRDSKIFLEKGIDIARPHANAQDAVILSERLSIEKIKTTWPKRFVSLGAVHR